MTLSDPIRPNVQCVQLSSPCKITPLSEVALLRVLFGKKSYQQSVCLKFALNESGCFVHACWLIGQSDRIWNLENVIKIRKQILKCKTCVLFFHFSWEQCGQLWNVENGVCHILLTHRCSPKVATVRRSSVLRKRAHQRKSACKSVRKSACKCCPKFQQWHCDSDKWVC